MGSVSWELSSKPWGPERVHKVTGPGPCLFSLFPQNTHTRLLTEGGCHSHFDTEKLSGPHKITELVYGRVDLEL